MQRMGIGSIVVICLIIGYAVSQDLYCAYSKKDTVKISVAAQTKGNDDDIVPYKPGELLENNTTEKCSNSNYCFALWQEDSTLEKTDENFTVIVAQGCWNDRGYQCTENTCVSNNKPQKSQKNTTTKFCCCTGYRCNYNFSDGFFPLNSREDTPMYREHSSNLLNLIGAILGGLLLMFLIVIVIAWRMWSSSGKPSPDSARLMEPPLPPSPTFNIDNLKIAENIGKGRYGTVYRGTLYNQSVAVKIFSAQNRDNYLNERYIYCLPFMDHTSLPKLIGAEERTGPDERIEYLLVLSYAPNGCLRDYLTNNTIDWLSFCKMATSITQGLAHLHMEIKKEDKLKMCVAHRDLTSRNIVIKADGTCMLCDFGFAICISGSKYYLHGEEQVAESTSLIDVGTFRYMAPEVLEGAVNLRDCESSLKQIDVYALGLILWELATRCSDLFQGVDAPEYKAPFVAEIGNHPSMEQLQHLIVKRKARPLFPDIWKDTNPAIRALKETIEDCWDQDAEARLTALCVEERLIELPILWDRHKAGFTIQGVSPTVNPTSTESSNLIQTSNNGWFRGSTFEMPILKSNSDALSPNNWDSRCSGDFSLSENTAETSITMSPTELTPRSCNSGNNNNLKNLTVNNNNITPSLKVTVPLQPYQGKNPTMERNLIMESAEKVTINGNSLIERGDKFSTRNNSNNSFNFEADIFNNIQAGEVSESNALVPNDVLGHSVRAVNPIPYVQNVVGTIPKQPNIPGNGHSLQAADTHKNAKKTKGEKGFAVGIRNFFKFPKSSHSGESNLIDTSTTPKVLEPPTVIVPKLPNTDQGTVPKPPGICNLSKVQSLDTEVYLYPYDDFSMTQTVVRPVANRQVYSQTVPTESGGEDSQPEPVEKPFQNGFVQSQTHPQLCSDGNLKMKRPNTLPVATLDGSANAAVIPSPIKLSAGSESYINHISHLDTMSNGRENSEASSSNSMKQPRFSLYDDSIMTSNSRQFIQNTPCKLGSPHISTSVPLSIDSLCESEVANFHNTFHSPGSKCRTNNNQ